MLAGQVNVSEGIVWVLTLPVGLDFVSGKQCKMKPTVSIAKPKRGKVTFPPFANGSRKQARGVLCSH